MATPTTQGSITQASTTGDWSASVLINYITDEIRTLEPNLEFAKFGVKRDVPKGLAVLAFPQTTQIVTTAVSTITEGTNPSAYSWGSTAYTSNVTQYGLFVQVTDILVRNSAIEVIDSAMRQIKASLARKLDNALQSTVNGSSNGVLYAGGRNARASLGSGDIMDTTLYTRGIRDLSKVNSNGVQPYANGAYAVIMHNSQEYDLMSNTNSGGWLDVARYATPSQIIEGKVNAFRGGMVYRSPNVQTFSSNQTVYPATFIGKESFGWGFFQQITPILVTQADSNNPLLLYTSIGGKFGLGVTLFENGSTSYRIVRAETAVSS